MDDYALSSSPGAWYDIVQVTVPTSVDGYTPKNNKLFSYPYSFCRIDDNNGHHTELKWELWNAGDLDYPSNRQLYARVPIDADASCFVIPISYNGEPQNVEQGLVFPLTGKCSWIYSAYQNWSAQNKLANVIGGLVAVGSIALPAVRGLSMAAKSLSMASGLRQVTSSGIRSFAMSGAAQRSAVKAGVSAALDKGGKTSMLGGLAGGAALASSVYSHSLVPSIAKGSSSGNSLIATEYNTFVVKKMCLQDKFAVILDDFFDKYGYEVDDLLIPNVTSRPYWNYIKMQGANHSSNSSHRIPSDDLEKINDIFNAGVTFWHTNDVGNYALDNRASIR